MDKKDILGKLGIIAAAAWLILFILAFRWRRPVQYGWRICKPVLGQGSGKDTECVGNRVRI